MHKQSVSAVRPCAQPSDKSSLLSAYWFLNRTQAALGSCWQSSNALHLQEGMHVLAATSFQLLVRILRLFAHTGLSG